MSSTPRRSGLRMLVATAAVALLVMSFGAPAFAAWASPDGSWGAGGVAQVTFADISGGAETGAAAEPFILPDGSVLVVGTTNGRLALAKFAAGGCLVAAWGTGGRVIAPAYSSEPRTTLVGSVMQPDGRLVVALDALTVARFMPDGSLDAGFGEGGMVSYQVAAFDGSSGTYTNSIAGAGIALDSDGAFVLTATVIRGDYAVDAFGYATVSNEHSDIGLVRLLSDGSPDPAFGTSSTATARRTEPLLMRHRVGGPATPTTGRLVEFDLNGNDIARGVNVDSAHNLVLAAGGGYTGDLNGLRPGSKDMLAARITGTGGLDAAFGSGGSTVVDFGYGPDDPVGVVVESNGRIVLGGDELNSANRYDFGLVGLRPDGVVDPAFGTTGTGRVTMSFSTSAGDTASALRLGPGDHLIMSGTTHWTEPWSNDNFAIVEFDAGGAEVGWATTDVDPTNHYNDVGRAAAVDANGAVVLAGASHDRFTVVRYRGAAVVPSVRLDVSEAQVVEGDAGTTAVDVTVSLSAPATCPVTFSYYASIGSAVASDYVAIPATDATIPVGSTSFTVHAAAIGDVLVESDEYFSIRVGNIVGAAGYDTTGEVWIRNDDFAPLVTSRSPADGATGVPLLATLLATFDQPLSSYSLVVTSTGQRPKAISGTVSYDPSTHTVSFVPARKLAALTTYRWSVSGTNSKGITTDGGGWSFTTGSRR